MHNERFPQLVIDLEKLRENIDWVVKTAGSQGINVTGVIKGFNGLPEMIEVYLKSGVSGIGSSRLDQLERAKELKEKMGIDKPLVLIRVPMLSEVEKVISITDASLNSEPVVLEALNKEAVKQGKAHRVILMADLGDLREGFWDVDYMVEAAIKVEKELSNLVLAGIGTNLGCYGALVPTAEKIGELIPIRDAIEKAIGRRLKVVSGGASTSFMRVMDDNMPEGVNHLRMGENILLARDNSVFFNYDTRPLHRDVFTLRAEVIEVKDKPSYPVGEICVDAFGKRPVYHDRGMRRRALLALGKVDCGSPDEIFPRREGVEVLGGSSDHTIVDVEGIEDIKVGDVLDFDIDYASMVYLTLSPDVKKVFKN